MGKKWMDRDGVAAMKISIKGLARFASSQGVAGEEMMENPTISVIVRVHAGKLSLWKKTQQNQLVLLHGLLCKELLGRLLHLFW